MAHPCIGGSERNGRNIREDGANDRKDIKHKHGRFFRSLVVFDTRHLGLPLCLVREYAVKLVASNPRGQSFCIILSDHLCVPHIYCLLLNTSVCVCVLVCVFVRMYRFKSPCM